MLLLRSPRRVAPSLLLPQSHCPSVCVLQAERETLLLRLQPAAFSTAQRVWWQQQQPPPPPRPIVPADDHPTLIAATDGAPE